MPTNPLGYIELMSPQINSDLNEDNSSCDPDGFIDSLKSCIIELKTHRPHQKITIDLLKNHITSISGPCQATFVNWLLKALDMDDTYCYAYNYLAQMTNREIGIGSVKIKSIDHKSLVGLMQMEVRSDSEKLSEHGLDQQELSGYAQGKANLTDSYSQSDEPETSTRQIVEEALGFMQKTDPRKHKKILTELDFHQLIGWVTYYFEHDQMPEGIKPIRSVNTNKGNVVYSFKELYREIHPSGTQPDSLFELIKRCFHEYRDDNISNYKKQSEPQYYQDLVSISQ